MPLAGAMLAGARRRTGATGGGAAAASKKSWSPRRRPSRTCRTCRSASRPSAPKRLEELNVDELRRLREVTCRACRTSPPGPGFARVFMRGVASGDNGNHSGPLPRRRSVSRRAADHHDPGRARHPHLRHRARRSAGRPAGHAVRRQLAGRHDPHHHQQARPVGLRRRLQHRGQHARDGDLGYLGRRLRQHSARRQAPPSAWSAGRATTRGYIDNVAATRTFPTSGISIDFSSAKDNYNDVDTYRRARRAQDRPQRQLEHHAELMARRRRATASSPASPTDLGDLEVAHWHPETATTSGRRPRSPSKARSATSTSRSRARISSVTST